MKVAVPVKDREQAEAVRTAWGDPTVSAFVIVLGTLMSLPSDRARSRVIQYVTDLLEEERDANKT